MSLRSRIASFVRNLLRKPHVESQLDDEVRAYVDLITDERIAAGMSATEARRTALADAGGMEQVKQSVRDHRAGTSFETFWQDLRFSIRQLRRSPGFTIAAVTALALGIGANTAIFSVVNTVLLKPLSYPDADRMVQFLAPSALLANNLMCVRELHAYQRQTSVFQEVAAYDIAGPGFNLAGDRPEQLHGIHVTESYFRLFGAPVLLGRTFTPQEDLPNGGRLVVLSYGLWQRKFSGDKSIVGRSITLGSDPYTVIGVLGKEFRSDPEADIWLPFQFDPASTDGNLFFRVTARLRPGVTLAQANAQLKLAVAQYRRDFPDTDPNQQFIVGQLRDSIVGDVRNSLLVLLGAVSLVLLIACANVANLLLVRATGRKRELAIRSALGAGRARIMRQLLTESVLLSITGGVLGLALGFLGVRALLAVSPAGLPRVGQNGSTIGVDWRVLGFTLAVSLFTGILFGLFPAFTASRSDLNSTLKEGGSRSGTGFRQGKARSLLVITEVSLALVLLIGSGLLIRTLVALRGVGPGFDTRNVLTMEMSLNGQRYQKAAGVAQLLRDGHDRLSRLPEVEASAAAYWLPNDVEDALGFQIVGRRVEKDCCVSAWMSITPDYLKLFKTPVLRGRGFTENDKAGTNPVALINEGLARQLWPNQEPIGQHVAIGEPGSPPGFSREIVGLVADTHNHGIGVPPDPMMMVPIVQVPDNYTAAYSDIQPLFWVVRTHGDPRQSVDAISEQLRLASGGFPVAHIRTMDEVMGGATARQSFNMMLLTIFGAIALFLAAIGIYGLMAYSVAQRTQEMGIRIALGADRFAIRKLVVWNGMKLAILGVVLGMAASFGLTRLIATFLFGVKPWDPAVFIAVPFMLAVVALMAVWLPARRASGVDPMQALRAE